MTLRRTAELATFIRRRLPGFSVNVARILVNFAKFANFCLPPQVWLRVAVGRFRIALCGTIVGFMPKSFAGASLRELRQDQGLTQAAFAAQLGISSSYLNQLENNVRSLSSRVLTLIAERYGVDLATMSSDSDTRLIAQLTDALTETGQSDGVPTSEIVEMVRENPNMAKAFLALYQQLGNTRQLLSIVAETRNALPKPGSVAESDLHASQTSRTNQLASTAMPHEEVRDYFAQRQNYIGSLDVAAEDLSTRIRMNRGDTRTVIGRRIETEHDVRVVRRVDLPDGVWHEFDPRTRRLELSAQLNRGQQSFRIATELAFLEHRELLNQLVDEASFSSPAARNLALRGLANYFAAAVLMPYGRFLESAEDFRYDIERLAAFYGTGYESVCHRLSTLQRPGSPGVPFSFVRVDRAGNMSKRQSASGFHFATSGGTCPLWNVYESFSSPGEINRQVAEMPDGRRYLWISRTVSTRSVRFGQARKTFAIGLGCEARHAHRTVYAQGLDLEDEDAATPIGIGCRLCERTNCPQRAFPPVSVDLKINAHRSSLSPYFLGDSR